MFEGDPRDLWRLPVDSDTDLCNSARVLIEDGTLPIDRKAVLVDRKPDPVFRWPLFVGRARIRWQTRAHNRKYDEAFARKLHRPSLHVLVPALLLGYIDQRRVVLHERRVDGGVLRVTREARRIFRDGLAARVVRTEEVERPAST